MTNTFCVLPWIHMEIMPDGTAQLCCRSNEQIQKQGIAMSLLGHSFNDIWNSDYYRIVRARMVNNQPVNACSMCYLDEQQSRDSYRTQSNAKWLPILNITIEEIKSKSIETNNFVFDSPKYLQLLPGNTCNLKCRMCNGTFSSSISKDVVHSQWAPEKTQNQFEWYNQDEILYSQLLSKPNLIKELYFTGGEPLFNGTVKRIMKYLINSGYSKQITLQFNSNLTVLPDSFLSDCTEFNEINLALSIDAMGDDYEYIRYPAKWTDVSNNIQKICKMAKFNLTAVPIIQIYNIVNIVDLCRYFDTLGVKFALILLWGPPFLRISLLPISIRKYCINVLTKYLDKECRPENKVTVTNLIQYITQMEEDIDQALLEEFMVFTNDLDKSRTQDFQKVHPMLYQTFIESGFPWTERTRYF